MANYDLTYEGSRVQSILDTGDELRDAGYIFRGEATPSTVPGTPTERVAYIGGPGTYTNFGSSITVGAGCICVFKYTGSAWSNQVINTGLSDAISSEASARQLGDSTPQGGINTVSAAITAINNAIGNGCVYAGIATPSSTPASGKVFYLAFTAGTYTNFNSLEVPQGINILKNNGSTWLLDSFLGIDDAPIQGSDNLVKSGGVLNSIIQNGPAFDLSAYNAHGGTLATYADLSAALTALNALPADFKKGGMSMKYVQTSDNKYVQYRLIADTFTTDIGYWYNDKNITNDINAEIYGDRKYNVSLPSGNLQKTEVVASNITIKAGVKYTLSVSSNTSITASRLGFFLVDADSTNLLELVLIYSSSTDTWDGSTREISFIASVDTIAKITTWTAGLANIQNANIVLNQDANIENTINELSEEVLINTVGSTFSKVETSTSAINFVITITKNIFANRIVKLRADALSGLKVLFGMTYTDGTKNQKYSYGGFCELYAEKNVYEVFIYIAGSDNTYSGNVTLSAQVCTADSGNDGLIYSTSFVKGLGVTQIKDVELLKGHTYVIVASADVEEPIGFFIDNNGTNLFEKSVTLTSEEQIVGEYTADANYNPKLTSWQPATGQETTINYKFYDKTVICKALWERLQNIENKVARNDKLFANTVYVAASNSSSVDKLAADYVCDGQNDEVEINQAIEDVGVCGTVILLEGEYFIDSFTDYDDYGYCGIVVKRHSDMTLRSVLIKGIRHYFYGTKITVRQAAFDAVSSENYINVFNVLSPINIDRTLKDWYVSLQDMFINIPTHSRKCVIVNLENAGCGEEKNLRISAFGNSEAPENGGYTTREEKMAFNDELVGIRAFHGWTYGDTVRMDNIAVWGCGEAFQLGGEHLIACNLRARINKCGYSFGRYGLTSNYGAFDHPNTLINCCDEQSIYGPRFVFCGLMDEYYKQQYPETPDTKLQCYTLIDFNCEAFEIPAEETVPGTFCGTIQFSSGSGTFGNDVNTQFWKNDGSGKKFRTINSSHALGGSTALRNTYTPQYMQQYYDETLSKLLIYDGTNWVDAEGNIVN